MNLCWKKELKLKTMTELIEKTSYSDKESEIYDLLVGPEHSELRDDVVRVQEYIAKEVELAYKAGMLNFNALDHTLKTPWENTVWTKANLNFMDTGNGVLLPSLYLQAKGFKK